MPVSSGKKYWFKCAVTTELALFQNQVWLPESGELVDKTLANLATP